MARFLILTIVDKKSWYKDDKRKSAAESHKIKLT
jgi:hypothetical protein